MESKRFPRGGKISHKASSSSEKNSHTAFFKSFCAEKSAKNRKSIKSNSKRKSGRKCVKSKTKQAKDEKKVEADIVLEPLRQEDLETHMLVLGRVGKIQQNGLLISLPGLLSGCVPLTAISVPYTRLLGSESEECPALSVMFSEGQYLSCMVTSIDLSGDKVKNTLSIAPGDINASLPDSCLAPGLMLQCAVKSEEDHAFDMDAGMLNTRAILPKASQRPKSAALLVGQVVWCMIDSVTSTDGVTTLTLTRQPGRLNSGDLPNDSPINSQTVLPGMQLSVSVAAVVSGGVQVSWNRDLPAFASSNYLTSPFSLPSDHSLKERYRSTVLYTLPRLRRTFVCLRTRLCEHASVNGPTKLCSGPVSGRVLEVSAAGVRLRCSNMEHVLFCPGWSVVPPPGGGRWRVGMEAQCWPVKYSHMDDVCVVSMRAAKVIDPVASCTLGQKVRGKVVGVDESGFSVRLNESHRMAVLPGWLTGPLSLGVGSKVRARVLAVRGSGMVVLVAVNRVVEGTSVQLASKGQYELGQTAWWLVERTIAGGVLLCGYGEARAFLPTTSSSTSFISSCTAGRLVHCRVKAVGDRTGKQRRVRVEAIDEPGACLRGTRQSATVLYREEEALTVSLEDGSRAVLSHHHLTDVPELAERALSVYKPGDIISVVILSGGDNGVLPVSAKPSFLRDVESGVRELQPGMVLPCCVRECLPDSVRVEFPCTALPPVLHILNSQLGSGWQQQRPLVGYTVMATLVSVSDGKFVLSARATSTDGGTPWLGCCLAELAALHRIVLPSIGEQVKAEVVSRQKDALQVKLAGFGEAVAVLPTSLQEGDAPVGSSISVSMLYVRVDGVCVVSGRHQTVPCHSPPRYTRSRAEIVSENSALFAVAVLLPPAQPYIVFIPRRCGFNDIAKISNQADATTGQVVLKITGLDNGVLTALLSDRRVSSGKFSKRSSGSFKQPHAKRPALKSPVRHHSRRVNYSRFSLADDE